MDECLVIDLKAASNRQSTNALFHSPALREKDKTFGKLRPLDDLDHPIGRCLDRLKEAVLVAAINHHGLDPGAQPHQALHERNPAVLVLDVRSRHPHGQQATVNVDGHVPLAAHDLLGSIVAPFPLRRVALDRLSIDDGQGWAGFSPSFLTVGHDEMMVDPFQVPTVGQQPPVVVADAPRREVLGQGVPRDAIALNIPNAVHGLAQHMGAWTPPPFGNRQERLQDHPLLVREVTGVSLATTVIARPILDGPHQGKLIQQFRTKAHATPDQKLYLDRLSQRTLTIAAKRRGRIQCRGGLVIEADASFDDAPRFDILWTPGGDPAALAERMEDRVFLDFLVRARILIKLSSPSQPRLAVPGVTERARLGNLVTAEATREGLEALSSHPEVIFVEAARPLFPDADAEGSGTKLEIPPGPLQETGRGVIVGVVDWGCDFTHDDFRDDRGQTRILYLWDQGASPAAGRHAPPGHAVGLEFSSADLNAALSQANPFASPGIDVPDLGAHGTHVMGIAAGSGRAEPTAGFRGMAPNADIIFVQPDTGDVGETGGFGDSVHLAEAIAYIFEKAANLGRPASVNLSMGTNSGPHDGTTLVEEWIDRLLMESGRAVTLALGNEHNERFNRTHSEGKIEPGETVTLYWRTLPEDYSPNGLEVWDSARDVFVLELEMPNGFKLPAAEPGQSLMFNIPGSKTKVYQSNIVHSPLNGDNQIFVLVVSPEDVPIEPGVWKVRVTARVSREGLFDAWIERDSMQGKSRQSNFIGGSYVRRKTLGSIQSARLAITCSNYDALTTTLADSTSFGPTRDNRRAPTLAAPGVDILSAKAMWRQDTQNPSPYIRYTGTSMSAPYVTGLVACMLERNPSLTATEIRAILTAAAKPAPGFDDMWRPDWGNGRADPVDSLAATPKLKVVADQPPSGGPGKMLVQHGSGWLG